MVTPSPTRVPSDTEPADVGIVGFGPVGAVLAGLLGRRGRRVVVVDRDTEPFRLPRAAHIDHTGLRTLQELGCLDELLPAMIPNHGLDFVTADRQLLMQVPGDQPSRSGLPASMYFHQPGVDRALRAAAARQPSVRIRLGATMTGLVQHDDGVVLQVRTADGMLDRVTARYVVGCDGASSPVREAAGIGLDTFGFDERWLVVDLVLADDAPALPRHAVHVCDPARPHTAIPMPGRRYRFELMMLPGDDVAWAQTQAGVDQLLGGWLTPHTAHLERAAVYTFHGLVADRWRAGRVFVAGDAAHQMPPFLGQGMCSGLRDATNLAWKLDAVLAGAADNVLDTFGSERRPHVSRIVRDVVAFGDIICALDPEVAAARDREILADPAPAARRVPFGLPALDPGPLVLPGGGQLFVQPEVADGAQRLDDMVGQRFLVLATGPDALGSTAEWWRERIGAVVAVLAGESDQRILPDPSGGLARFLARAHARVVVVRPDRYVLGTADDLGELTARVVGLLGGPRGLGRQVGDEAAHKGGQHGGLVQDDEVTAVLDQRETTSR